MNLEEKYSQKLKELHKKKTGEDISDAQALEFFMSLIELVRHVYKPIPRSKKKEFERLINEQNGESK